MTPTVTLKDVRAEQVARLQTDINTITALAKKAAADQAAAQKAIQSDEALLTQLRSGASALRQQFATAAMKQEQHAIELQLYQNGADQREAGISLAADQDRLAAVTQRSQTLTGQAAALQAALAQAKAVLSAAEQEDAATGDDRTALTTLVADAVRQAGGADVTAQANVARDTLAKLAGGANMAAVLQARYDRARAVISDKQSAVARAEAAAWAVTRLASPGAADLDAAAAGYRDARARVHRWATEGPGALDAARQALAQTIGTPPFPPPVADDIAQKAQAATASTAADKDQGFHRAALASIAADAAFNAVTGPKSAVDPGYDPATDDAVKPQRDAAEAADQALQAADAARTPELKKPMTDWDLAVPPVAFPLAVTTFDALAQIAGLAVLDITKLLTDLDAAETAYAAALRTQGSTDGLRQAAADKLAGRQADADRYAADADQRVLAVVRGDL